MTIPFECDRIVSRKGDIMDFNEIDRIVISQKEITELFKWKDENKELVRNYKPLLLEGVIEFGNSYLYFKHSKENTNLITFKLYAMDKLAIKFDYNKITWLATNQYFDSDFSKLVLDGKTENKEKMLQDLLTLHSSLMAFVQNYESEIEIREEKKRVTKKTNKKSKKAKKNNKNKKVSKLITKKVYIIPDNVKEVIEKEDRNKRPYTRQTDIWTRRGHMRTYRDKQGNVIKRVWVRPTLCKAKGKKEGKKEGKIYKLGIDNTQNK